MEAVKAYFDGITFVPLSPVNVKKTRQQLLPFWTMRLKIKK